MSTFVENGLVFVFPTIILLHLLACPYTKVEESFNIQATHDILHYGLPVRTSSVTLTKYFDHVQFPGPIPRTFVGSLLLAGAAMPFNSIMSLTTNQQQILVRALLGLVNAAALWLVKRAVDTAYGRVAGAWYVILQASQFHIMFYASRTLPNMFAFPLVIMAQRHLIFVKAMAAHSRKSRQRRKVALYLLTLAGVIFRSEIAILLTAETVWMLLRQKVSLTREIVPAGLLGAGVGLVVTIGVDTFFWQRFPLWPEWIGLYYNVVLGKSADWGTEPIHYYFLSALPRLLLNPIVLLLCIPWAVTSKVLRQTSRDILFPHLVFIAAYSLLPHKETRFIIYCVPAFTAVAAAAAGWIWTRRTKTLIYKGLSFLMIIATLLSFIASIVLLYISSLNYPGGEALRRLHLRTSSEPTARIHVHLGNLACQTGVSRFQQVRPSWTYDKTEDETALADPVFWQKFDYVLEEDPHKLTGQWDIIDVVRGFGGVTLRPGAGADILPLRYGSNILLQQLKQVYSSVAMVAKDRVTRGRWPAVNMEPRIYVLQKKPLNVP